MRRKIFLLIILAIPARAIGAGASGGVTLLRPGGARAAAVGEAFSAVPNDISALVYNPAILSTLRSNQATFLLQQGLADDSFGHMGIGLPQRIGSAGINIGYYDGGDFEFFDGATVHQLDAKSDWSGTVAYALPLGPVHSGLGIKYLSSELVEEEKATAWAADLGLLLFVRPGLIVSMSAQNFGSKLRFVNREEDLPRIVRIGGSQLMFARTTPTRINVEFPYYVNESDLRPAVGVETVLGSLSFRVGYQTGEALHHVTFGTGIRIGAFLVDYGFGLVDDLDSMHLVSLSMNFGENGRATDENISSK